MLVGPDGGWRTSTVFVTPPPVKVTVPDRPDVPVFAVAEIVAVPLPEPLAGVTVSQVAALLETDQAPVVVTVTARLDAAADGAHESVLKFRFEATAAA